MAHTEFADRIKETTTTTGTGTINLGGAVSGYQTFVQGLGNGHYTYYSIFHQAADEWEVGLGLVTDAATDTLSRDTVISSSNAGSLVNFSAGTKDVICTMPAAKSVIIDGDSNISVTANMTATSFAGSGAALTSLNATNVASGTLDDARLTGNVVLTSGATFTGNVAFPDTTFLKFGTSNDMAIYHDGNNSYVKDLGTGNLILAGDQVIVLNTAANQTKAVFTTNGSVQLYHNGSEKFATATGGVTITGTATATTFSGSGASLTTLNASNVSSGTLDSARLSGDVVLTSGATFTGNVAFGDSNFINMGASSDLQIGHDHLTGVSSVKDINVGGTLNLEGDSITLTGPVTATANVSLGDDDFLRQGDSNEFSIVHEGSTGNTYLRHTPSAPLYIRADKLRVTNSNLTETLLRADNNGDVQLYYDNSVKFKTTTSGATVTGTVVSDGLTVDTDTLYVDAANNRVGINTTSPTQPLTVYSASAAQIHLNTTNPSIRFSSDTAGSTDATRGFIGYATNSDAFMIGSASGDLVLRGNSAGSVLIGTPTVKTLEVSSTGIDVTGTITFDGGTTTADLNFGDNDKANFGAGNDLQIYHDGSHSYIDDAGTGNLYIRAANDLFLTNADTTKAYFRGTNAGASTLYYDNSQKLTTATGGIAVSGAITATGDITAFYTSDETLKTNIANIENPMEKVAQINGVSYNWTEEAQAKYDHLNGDKEIGVIAQQVEKVLPEMVSTRDDGTKAVRYERMCALLIECVKDLQNQVNELKGAK